MGFLFFVAIIVAIWLVVFGGYADVANWFINKYEELAGKK